LFLGAFLYSIAFVGGFGVPRTVDNGTEASIAEAVIVNVLLLGLFAVQHSVMARPAFKQWWTRLVPNTIERSTYVLLSSLLLFLLFWQWRTMPTVIWDVTWAPGRIALWVVFAAGWMLALVSTFLINHFDLFGLRQVYLAWRGTPYTDVEFRESLFYRVVRHPLMLGFILAFWAIPTMTAGHLLFAVATTGYILIAMQLEEHDLSAALGERYREYRSRVPMIVPGLHRRSAHTAPDATARPA
jgi:protein-S-isoprenylcysteine O-methyltransferase Ste14